MHPVSPLSRGNQRYHVTLGSRRTSVSLDNFLSLLLSLKLGHTPQTPQAQRAVRHWLQARLDEHGDYNRVQTSQWLTEEVLHALISAEVTNLYDQWMNELFDRERSARQQALITHLATAAKSG